MAYLFVQAKMDNAAAAVGLAYDANVMSGNTLVVAVDNDEESGTVSLGSSGTATLGTIVKADEEVIGVRRYAVFVVPVTGTGTCTITASATSATNFDFHLLEYSGLTSPALDQSVGNAVNGSDSPGDSGTTPTTTQANELIFGFIAVPAFTPTVPGDMTQRTSGGGLIGRTADKRVTATGAYNFAPTWTGGAQTYGSIVAALKEVGGASENDARIIFRKA